MARKATDLMTAKTVRRTRRQDGPQLGEIERICFVQLNDKLDRIANRLVGQTVKSLDIADRVMQLVRDEHATDPAPRPHPAAPARHLHTVK